MGEGFGAVKDVKVGGFKDTYIRRYSDSAQTFKDATSSAIISQLPRFFLEAIALGGVLLLILYLMAQSGSLIILYLLSVFMYLQVIV